MVVVGADAGATACEQGNYKEYIYTEEGPCPEYVSYPIAPGSNKYDW